MEISTKERIFQAAKKLWFEKGYDNTTMRDIARECNMAIGNLTYHYPRKDDILMVYHDRILNAADHIAHEEKSIYNGCIVWTAVEYAFLRYIADDRSISELYRQVINSSSLRARYVHSHDKLYQEWTKDENALEATAAVCSLAFGMMQMHYLNDDFDDTFRKMLSVHHLFLHQKKYEIADIEYGILTGKQFLAKMPGNL